jgi:hypothetical protein
MSEGTHSLTLCSEPIDKRVAMRRYLILIILSVIAILSCRKDEVVNSKADPHDFLSSSKYEKLTIEMQYVSGHEPTAAAVTNLKNFLEQRLNKPGGISIVQTAISSPGRSTYTLNDIRDIEESKRTQNTSRKNLTAYFLFLDGDYAGNSGNAKVLGIAYENSSMVIFEKTIRNFSGGVTQPAVSTLESTVMLHEFGHILGLVNNGSPMQVYHQDEPNGHHCNNQNCLMYYAAETSDIVGNLLGGNVPALDSKCIADLQANGGK